MSNVIDLQSAVARMEEEKAFQGFLDLAKLYGEDGGIVRLRYERALRLVNDVIEGPAAFTIPAKVSSSLSAAQVDAVKQLMEEVNRQTSLAERRHAVELIVEALPQLITSALRFVDRPEETS